MSVFAAALISFFSVWLISRHLSAQTMRRIVGYPLWFDLALHGAIMYVFLGSSTLGLLQAELSGLMISCYLRGYRYFNGFERFERMRWVRYAGKWTTNETSET